LKYIRIDNGGEYRGPFDIYCKQQHIKHEDFNKNSSIEWSSREDQHDFGLKC